MTKLSGFSFFYVYTGIGLDECIGNFSNYETALEVMRKNDYGTAYIVNSSDRFVTGNFRSYLESFNCNDTII